MVDIWTYGGHLASGGGGRDTACLCRAEGAKEHIGEGAIHGLAHRDREDEAAEAVERANDNQNVVVDRKSRGDGREAGIRIQQRHDHRHVRAADRQDKEDPDEHGDR